MGELTTLPQTFCSSADREKDVSLISLTFTLTVKYHSKMAKPKIREMRT